MDAIARLHKIFEKHKGKWLTVEQVKNELGVSTSYVARLLASAEFSYLERVRCGSGNKNPSKWSLKPKHSTRGDMPHADYIALAKAHPGPWGIITAAFL